MIQKKALSLYGTSFGVCLFRELEEPKGYKGPRMSKNASTCNGYDEGLRGQRAGQDISLLVSSSCCMIILFFSMINRNRERGPELQRAEPLLLV